MQNKKVLVNPDPLVSKSYSKNAKSRWKVITFLRFRVLGNNP
jgi:hypothetical protein